MLRPRLLQQATASASSSRPPTTTLAFRTFALSAVHPAEPSSPSSQGPSRAPSPLERGQRPSLVPILTPLPAFVPPALIKVLLRAAPLRPHHDPLALGRRRPPGTTAGSSRGWAIREGAVGPKEGSTSTTDRRASVRPLSFSLSLSRTHTRLRSRALALAFLLSSEGESPPGEKGKGAR